MASIEHKSSFTDPNSFFSFLEGKSWYQIITENHDDLSSAYIDIVSEFSTILKEKLKISAYQAPNITEFLNFLKVIKSNLLSSVDSLLQKSQEDLVTTSEVLAKSEALENKEEIVCNLFSRVLTIFTKNGRSLNDLYQEMDFNKDGIIKFAELRAEFLKYDPSITLDESQAVFDILDGNHDGVISLQELTKRMKYIREKAEQELIDPLSCLVISKPLDPNLIHGNLTVMLIKGEDFKQGTRNVRIKVSDFLEYLTPDATSESSHTWNFRTDFMFENKTEKELPLLIDIELVNKGVIEGTGCLQWKKAMNVPNEFSFKPKVLMKTSTGQGRGTLHFQIKWTPICVQTVSSEEIEKLNALEKHVKEHQKRLREIKRNKKIEEEKYDKVKNLETTFDESFYDFNDTYESGDDSPEKSKMVLPATYSYVLSVSESRVEKVLERKVTMKRAPRVSFTTLPRLFKKPAAN